MARPNPMRSIEGETNLARRVALERRSRGWSYDALAKRMTDAGCPINASAIFKIEKGDPPRKIQVDELLALATVFEADVMDLLTPMAVYRKERGKEIVATIEEGRDGLARSVVALVQGYMDYFELAVFDPELREFVDNRSQWQEIAEDQVDSGPLFTIEIGERTIAPKTERIREAAISLHLAIIETADEVFRDVAGVDSKEDAQ